MWFMQEVGELATALRSGDREEQMLEFADVLAWLATLANIAGVDLDEAMRIKYGAGCPDRRVHWSPAPAALPRSHAVMRPSDPG